MNYKLEKIGFLRKYKPIYRFDEKVVIGSSVKLVFRLTDKKDVQSERLWVNVTKISEGGRNIEGYIDNDPIHIDLKYKDKITFKYYNIFDIDNS